MAAPWRAGGSAGCCGAGAGDVEKLGVNDLAEGLKVNDLALALSLDLGLSFLSDAVSFVTESFALVDSILAVSFDSAEVGGVVVVVPSFVSASVDCGVSDFVSAESTGTAGTSLDLLALAATAA